MTRKTAPDHPQSNANRVLRDACVRFDECLKTFIKNAQNDQGTAHVAAQVLFEVRRLENALSPANKCEKVRRTSEKRFSASVSGEADSSGPKGESRDAVTVIPPVDRADL